MILLMHHTPNVINNEPRLTADNITVAITGLGIKPKVKVHLEGALP